MGYCKDSSGVCKMGSWEKGRDPQKRDLIKDTDLEAVAL